MSPWAVVGNILWLVLGPGIAWFVFWCLSGLILALTVVGFWQQWGYFADQMANAL